MGGKSTKKGAKTRCRLESNAMVGKSGGIINKRRRKKNEID